MPPRRFAPIAAALLVAGLAVSAGGEHLRRDRASAQPDCAERPAGAVHFARSPGGAPEVDASWLASHRCQVRLIDVREPGEIAREGAVPGAENVPMARLAELASRADPEAPMVLVCRSGRRSSRAAEQLSAAGLRKVASLTGGVLSWKASGHPTMAPTEPAASEPGVVERLSSHDDAVTFTTAARLFTEGTSSCVDGRSEAPVIGTPGGDVGDLALSLSALERLSGQRIDEARLDALLPRYVASFGRFYLHTDDHALGRLRRSLLARGGFDELASVEGGEALRRYVLSPPVGKEDAVIDALAQPEHVGCGHLRLQLSRPDDYGVRPGLLPALLRAVFRLAHRQREALDFVVLEGEHDEKGVLLVHTEGPVEAHSRVPMLTPHAGLSAYFVYHPEVVAFVRRETAHFLAEQRAVLGLPDIEREALASEVEALGKRQLDQTLRALAPGLPVVEVRPVERDAVTAP